jgi:hypothetical protein
LRLRASGTDDSAANYRQQELSINGTGVIAARNVNVNRWTEVIYFNTYQNENELIITNPFNTTTTLALSKTIAQGAGNPELYLRALGLNTSTSYDSLSVIKTSGTFSGSVSVYGLAK